MSTESLPTKTIKPLRRRLIEGGCVVLLVIWLRLILFPPTTYPRSPQNPSCPLSMHKLSTGLIMYAQDYDDRFPNSDRWANVTRTYNYLSEGQTCPEAVLKEKNQRGIAFHSLLSERHIYYEDMQKGKALPTDVIFPESMPLLFDTRLPGKNAAALLLTGLARPGRHPREGLAGNHILSVDGHLKWISDRDAATLRTTLR